MVLKCNNSNIIFRQMCIWTKLNEQNLRVYDYSFTLNITLPCKTGRKTCWLFVSLPRRFLRYYLLLNFICLEYDDTVNLYSVWYLKKIERWEGGGRGRGKRLQGGKFTGEIFQWEFTSGEWARSNSPREIHQGELTIIF